MNNDARIIEIYRQRDEGERIFMFLDYPHLRSEFFTISTKDARLKRKSTGIKHAKRSARRLWAKPAVDRLKTFFHINPKETDHGYPYHR